MLAASAGFVIVVGYVTFNHVETAEMSGNTIATGQQLGANGAEGAMVVRLAPIPAFVRGGSRRERGWDSGDERSCDGNAEPGLAATRVGGGRPAARTGADVHRAAHSAAEATRFHLSLPIVGTVTRPPQHAAWYAGIGALAALEIIDWPVAFELAIGKALADDGGDRALEAFGRALEDAG